MRTSSRFCVVSALTALGCLLCAEPANASGFSTARFGGEHGNPVTTNPTAIYYNPAGLAESEGIHLFLDANLAIRRASYKHTPHPSDVAEPPGAEGANTDKATLFNVLAAPMFGASANFGGFAVGAGVYVPFGGTSIWDKNERFKDSSFPGPYDNSQRWYSLDGTIKSTYYSVGAAYKIPSTGLSIGVSGNLVNSVVDTIRARVSDGSNDIDNEGRTYVDVSGWQYAFGVGLMYEALPEQLYLGLSYQSKPNVTGGMVLKGRLWNKLGPTVEKDEIELTQDMPDVYRFGVKYRMPPDWEVRISTDYTRWSAFENQCLASPGDSCEVDADGKEVPGSGTTQNLPRHWKDAFGVKLSGSYFVGEPLEIMLGAGYDGNAIPDEALDPALMDFHDISASLGARYQVVDPMFVALTFTQLFYFSRDTAGNNKNSEWHTRSRSPDSGGKYEQTISLVNANVEFVF
jgi:long-chain fatty acid transport protein